MKTLKTTSIAMMVLLVASFGLMAADMEKSAQFSIGESYTLSVYNETSLEFPSESNVGSVDAADTYTTSALEVKLDHNYDVQLTSTGTSFNLDTSTSDYGEEYAIPATWSLLTKKVNYSDNSYSEAHSNTATLDSDFSKTVDAGVGDTEGEFWAKIDVSADRNGLDDPQGTYTAELDITVSDLN